MSFPSLRHNFLSGIFKVPEFFYSTYMRSDLISRDFESINNKLNNYFSLVNFIKIEKNRLAPGFLDLLSRSYDSAILDSEKIKFKNIMEQSLLYDPKNIFILTSLIEIYSIVDPSLNEKINFMKGLYQLTHHLKKYILLG